MKPGAKSASNPKSKIVVSKPATISLARREAFVILREVERGEAHADDLLRGSRVTALSQQDRNLCTTLVLGTLRWQIRLDAIIQTLLSRPNAKLDSEIRIALRMGAFQLLFLDRIPAHAAIGESVGLAKQAGHKFASGMVNAVLRKVADLPKPSTDVADDVNAAQLAEATAHPAWLVERWVAQYGFETARAICQQGQQQPVPGLRLDTEAVVEIEAEGTRLKAGAILTAARTVIEGDVTATRAFRDGRVRIQEEGSQLIAELAGKAAEILDCCAAPGGKTLVLAEGNPESRVVASEASAARLQVMRDRLSASEFAGKIEFRQADATQVSSGDAFDLILADVPCSGTGTLGRNPEIRHRLAPMDLARHHERQCRILRTALESTNAGGRVVYSTCSLEPEENESVISAVLGEASDWKQISWVDRIRDLLAEGKLTGAGAEYLLQSLGNDGALRLLPGKVSTDGFFVALLARR